MRYKMSKAVAGVTFAALTASGAAAQGVGVEIYGGPYSPYYPYAPFYYYEDTVGYGYAPRVYGYYRTEPVSPPAVALTSPTRPGSCGVYHYWNGSRCADARVTPPDLN
jgi:hypothetical protein